MEYYLLLDSSNTSLTVALANKDSLIDEISYEAWQTQSEHMIPEINNLLNKHNVRRNDIIGVMVSIGPGSYTGVRIALTIAKVIALSRSSSAPSTSANSPVSLPTAATT